MLHEKSKACIYGASQRFKEDEMLQMLTLQNYALVTLMLQNSNLLKASLLVVLEYVIKLCYKCYALFYI